MAAQQQQWHGMRGLLARRGPLQPEWFDPEDAPLTWLQEASRVLVVGAGGLGCELLKCLALSGFRDIHVIDLDTIDISNLNRQFLFRRKHVGMYKAEVAAQVIRDKFPDVSVKPHTCRIQEFRASWYAKFDLVIAGLDNVEARRWLNRTLHSLLRYDSDGDVDTSSMIPLIDGGTAGLMGQARLFLPGLSSCFECSIGSLPAQKVAHHCTIASTPRVPEHAIQFVHEVMWPRLSAFRSADDYELQPEGEKPAGAVRLDTDNGAHMTWIYNRSVERATSFGIQGVTYKLVMQVVKNIVPSIASTNAIIAAACLNEAVKFGTKSSQLLDNFMLYNGARMEGCGLHSYARLPECPVCRPPVVWAVPPATTLAELRARAADEFKIEEPDLGTGTGPLYIGKFADQYAENLAKSLEALGVADNARVNITGAGKRQESVVVVFPGDDEDEEDEEQGDTNMA